MSIEPRLTDHENLPLLLDLVAWVARQPRTRAEMIETWGTSCPRLPVWEDAVDLGFVDRRLVENIETVSVTQLGTRFLRDHGRPA
jgi:hypothetical protein